MRWNKRIQEIERECGGIRGYRKLKEKAVDRTLWSSSFGRGFVPVVRLQNE